MNPITHSYQSRIPYFLKKFLNMILSDLKRYLLAFFNFRVGVGQNKVSFHYLTVDEDKFVNWLYLLDCWAFQEQDLQSKSHYLESDDLIETVCKTARLSHIMLVFFYLLESFSIIEVDFIGYGMVFMQKLRTFPENDSRGA